MRKNKITNVVNHRKSWCVLRVLFPAAHGASFWVELHIKRNPIKWLMVQKWQVAFKPLVTVASQLLLCHLNPEAVRMTFSFHASKGRNSVGYTLSCKQYLSYEILENVCSSYALSQELRCTFRHLNCWTEPSCIRTLLIDSAGQDILKFDIACPVRRDIQANFVNITLN